VHIDPHIVLGSAAVGFPVGMTGAGGATLMTPMLILLFGVKPRLRSPATRARRVPEDAPPAIPAANRIVQSEVDQPRRRIGRLFDSRAGNQDFYGTVR
jgi:hypothetical protein